MKVRNRLAKGIVIGATVATLTGAITSYVWADAKDLYSDNCAGCHGPGGKGDGPAGKMLSRHRRTLPPRSRARPTTISRK